MKWYSKISYIPRNRFIYWIFFPVNIAGVFVQSLLYVKLFYAHGSSHTFAEQWTNECSERVGQHCVTSR